MSLVDSHRSGASMKEATLSEIKKSLDGREEVERARWLKARDVALQVLKIANRRNISVSPLMLKRLVATNANVTLGTAQLVFDQLESDGEIHYDLRKGRVSLPSDG